MLRGRGQRHAFDIKCEMIINQTSAGAIIVTNISDAFSRRRAEPRLANRINIILMEGSFTTISAGPQPCRRRRILFIADSMPAGFDIIVKAIVGQQWPSMISSFVFMMLKSAETRAAGMKHLPGRMRGLPRVSHHDV